MNALQLLLGIKARKGYKRENAKTKYHMQFSATHLKRILMTFKTKMFSSPG